jgi:hypothetical protein
MAVLQEKKAAQSRYYTKDEIQARQVRASVPLSAPVFLHYSVPSPEGW